jgi:hypothetical protein
MKMTIAEAEKLVDAFDQECKEYGWSQDSKTRASLIGALSRSTPEDGVENGADISTKAHEILSSSIQRIADLVKNTHPAMRGEMAIIIAQNAIKEVEELSAPPTPAPSF